MNTATPTPLRACDYFRFFRANATRGERAALDHQGPKSRSAYQRAALWSILVANAGMV
jgi:hypothetical protein